MSATLQLPLPLPGADGSPLESPTIPRLDRVFVNRNLRMSTVDWIGFDMDYTVAIYRQAPMDALSVELTISNLIKRGYPESLRKLNYDTRFPIRGLLVDRKLGNVLKMDRHKIVHRGYHGMRRLTREELNDHYQQKRIRPHSSRYHWIDSLFALSEVISYAVVVDALEKRGDRVDFDRVFADVRESIDEAHRDGTFHQRVTAAFDEFVDKDAQLARTLHKLRSAGKKLFLLTNSPLAYTDKMLSYLLGGQMIEYPSWRHYFDVIVCLASKPSWFLEGRPFMERDGDALRHVRGPLERGRIYEGGNLRDFERLTGAEGGSVLYVGDHIYGDILRSKKESSWRTAMIIQELDEELAAHEECEALSNRQRELDDRRDRLEDQLRYYQARFKELQRGEDTPVRAAERTAAKRSVERVRFELRQIEAEHEQLSELVARRFHPYWGSLLKEAHEMSSFGLQVDSYADIYMRRVSSLRSYSPQQFFRSPFDLMPHEL